MNTGTKWLARILVIQVIIWGVVPLGLIYFPATPTMPEPTKLDMAILKTRISTQAPALETYKASDGSQLNFRSFASANESAPLMVLVHGSGWHSLGYHGLAKAIADSGAANVLTPDLRGHGVNPKRRGDVSYVGQLEDDIADLIKAKRKTNQKLILAGHSSGGGFVIRFAGGEYGNMLDGAVLLAPYLHHTAPIDHRNAGDWAYPRMPRLIGLSMQNMVGIHALDNKDVLYFNHPKEILEAANGETATKTYSHRLLASYHPRDNWQQDASQLPAFLLIVGEEDQAFKAKQYEPLMSPHTDKGIYEIVPNLNHSTILIDPRPVRSIVRFLERL